MRIKTLKICTTWGVKGLMNDDDNNGPDDSDNNDNDDDDDDDDDHDLSNFEPFIIFKQTPPNFMTFSEIYLETIWFSTCR